MKDHGYGRYSSFHKINFVRYCDDFIVTATDKEILEDKVIPSIKEFLAPRGLVLSAKKIKITHIRHGIDFLGQNLRKYGDKLLIKPSRRNVDGLRTKIKAIFHKMRAASAWALIRKLNPVLRGWAYYHRHIVAKETYRQIDGFIFQKLRRWLKRKHPDKSWRWINRKHYHHPILGKSQFFDRGKDGEIVTLYKVATTKIYRHVKIKSAANPFEREWELYFEGKYDQQMLRNATGKLRRLYQRQQGRCTVCQTKITKETGWHIHHVMAKHLGGSDNMDNLQLLHPNCHRQLHYQQKLSEQPKQAKDRSVVSFA